MSVELNREGWAPTKYDNPEGTRQWSSGTFERELTVTAYSEGSCSATVNVVERVRNLTSPEEAAQAAEKRRDLMLAAPKLRDALAKLLLSADVTWEERGLGHDWREACELAREVLDETKSV